MDTKLGSQERNSTLVFDISPCEKMTQFCVAQSLTFNDLLVSSLSSSTNNGIDCLEMREYELVEERFDFVVERKNFGGFEEYDAQGWR
ncbi:hypothetical protein LIER_12132 [Lithospermum erythrorhizon]|uniref:Uncharacterized protein n=1 Tax=Lithospermum erythrorhizon TaxID=34254 RepID=A0AAV3PSA5_LITER